MIKIDANCLTYQLINYLLQLQSTFCLAAQSLATPDVENTCCSFAYDNEDDDSKVKQGVSGCCCLSIHVVSEILSSPSQLKLFIFGFFNKCASLQTAHAVSKDSCNCVRVRVSSTAHKIRPSQTKQDVSSKRDFVSHR